MLLISFFDINYKNYIYVLFFLFFFSLNSILIELGIGDWGLGIGDW